MYSIITTIMGCVGLSFDAVAKLYIWIYIKTRTKVTY